MAAAGLEVRREGRFPLTADIRAGWIDDSRHLRYAPASGVNISANGMAIRVAERPRLSALVYLDLGSCGFSTLGRVRSCVRAEGGWRVGIELSSAFASGERKGEYCREY
jgi:hypothetical protein